MFGFDIPGRPASLLKNRGEVVLREKECREYIWRSQRGTCGQDIMWERRKKKEKKKMSLTWIYALYGFIKSIDIK